MRNLLFILFNLIIISTFAQEPIQVSGNISDAKTNEPLIGVSILVAGTNTGTVTNFDGDFELSVAPNSTLKITYIGYQPFEMVVKESDASSPLSIFLKEDSFLMDEVVVVGYTVQKRRDVLGAISKVDQKELIKTPVSSAQQALQEIGRAHV